MTTARRTILLRLVFVICHCMSFGDPRKQSRCLWPTRSGPCEFCELGWYGDQCQHKCINCDIGGCDKRQGICLQCSDGYYTIACTTTCPPHCGESYDGKIYCGRDTGKCLENCKPTWWGDRCEKKCSDGCVDNHCYFYDGSCVTDCVAGWSGEKCNVKCPINCKSTQDGTKVCDRKTGNCPEGCNDGWWGERCELKCSSECVNTCYHTDGSCTDECKTAWAGDRCDIQCPPGCRHSVCTRYNNQNCVRGCKHGFYGDHCNLSCNPYCRHRGCFSDHVLKSEICKHGCIEGRWSHDCQKICPMGCTCTQDTGCITKTEVTTNPGYPESTTGGQQTSTGIIYWNIKLLFTKTEVTINPVYPESTTGGQLTSTGIIDWNIMLFYMTLACFLQQSAVSIMS